ncbi:nitroreductase family protein [Paraburkholderia caribensis]
MTFLEAARRAPASYNSQPWRFVHARRGTLGPLSRLSQRVIR